jgi:hypothetical protein
VARTRFDTLEQKFETELPEVLQKAAQARETDASFAARVLDGFTASCVRQVVSVITELLREFD